MKEASQLLTDHHAEWFAIANDLHTTVGNMTDYLSKQADVQAMYARDDARKAEAERLNAMTRAERTKEAITKAIDAINEAIEHQSWESPHEVWDYRFKQELAHQLHKVGIPDTKTIVTKFAAAMDEAYRLREQL